MNTRLNRRAAQVLCIAAVTGLLLPGLAACSDDSSTTKLTVFAASSLTESFTTLAKDFEKDHSNVDVVLSFGSSTDLATSVKEGSPADVIATADDKSMGIATDAGSIDGDPTQFATNTMIIVTPPDNPGNVKSIDDLAHADFVVCDPSVPCGAAAATVLDNAGVTAQPKSLEADVKSVLAKITLGEADAGIVYVTDAQAAGSDVATVDIAPDLEVVNPYFVGVVKNSGHTDTAQQWVDLVTSEAGQSVLKDAGFGSP